MGFLAAPLIGMAVSSLVGKGAQALTPQNEFRAGPLAIEGNQMELVDALKRQASGIGPNPAQEQYKQNVNQAIARSTGMAASQRGISPALAQRMSMQTGADLSQQAAGNAATLQAQQQLEAQRMQGAVMQNIGQQQLGAMQANAGASAQNASANQNTAGGMLGGIGRTVSAFFHEGGEVKHYAEGGAVNQNQFSNKASSDIANQILAAGGIPVYSAGNSSIGQSMGSMVDDVGQALAKPPQIAPREPGFQARGPMADKMGSMPMMNKGGRLPDHLHAIASIYHPGYDSKGTEMLQAAGGAVPGQAPVAGDSLKNDVVPTMLSPKEIVLPRSVTMSKDPVKSAAQFVAEELRKNGRNSDEGSPEEFKEALKKAIRSRKAA